MKVLVTTEFVSYFDLCEDLSVLLKNNAPEVIWRAVLDCAGKWHNLAVEENTRLYYERLYYDAYK